MYEESKPCVYLPFEVLPEGQHWKVNNAYRVKLVLRQVSLDEKGASFEVVDATSLESGDRSKRAFYSDGGILKG